MSPNPNFRNSQRQAQEERARAARILANEAARDQLLHRAYEKDRSIILAHLERGWSHAKCESVWGAGAVKYAADSLPKPVTEAVK